MNDERDRDSEHGVYDVKVTRDGKYLLHCHCGFTVGRSNKEAMDDAFLAHLENREEQSD